MQFSGPIISGRLFMQEQRTRCSIRMRAFDVDGEDSSTLAGEEGQGVVIEFSIPCYEVLMRGSRVIAVNMTQGILCFDPPTHLVVEGEPEESTRTVLKTGEPIYTLPTSKLVEFDAANITVKEGSLLDRYARHRSQTSRPARELPALRLDKLSEQTESADDIAAGYSADSDVAADLAPDNAAAEPASELVAV